MNTLLFALRQLRHAEPNNLFLESEYVHCRAIGRLSALQQYGSMGATGRYLYRYRLMRYDQPLVPYFTVTSGSGTLSAFNFPALPPHTRQDDNSQVSPVNDFIMYELMVDDALSSS